MWADDAAVLGSRFTTIRYDARSFGQSSDAAGDYSQHEDLAALLDHLGIGRVAIVGLSMGGAIALDFAAGHPERVSALVLAAAVYGGFEWSVEGAVANEEADEPLERADVTEAIERNLRLWVAGPTRSLQDVKPPVVALMRQMLTDNLGRPGDEPRQPATLAGDRLLEIGAPTLVVTSDLDLPDISRAGRELAGTIPDARWVEIAGAAHMINLEQPGAFREVVGAHLESLWSGVCGP